MKSPSELHGLLLKEAKEHALKKKSKDKSFNWGSLLPWAAGAGIGAGAYKYLRTPSFIDKKVAPGLRKIQEMSKGDLVRYDPFIESGKVTNKNLSFMEKIKANLARLGDIENVGKLPDKSLGKALGGTKENPKAMVYNLVGRQPKGTFSPLHYGMGQKAKYEDKLWESKLLNKHAPNAHARTMSIEELKRKYKLPNLRNDARVSDNLKKYQDALKQEFNGRYIVKQRQDSSLLPNVGSSGSFPTEKTDLSKVHADWNKIRKAYVAHAKETERLGVAPNRTINAFRDKPGYKGRIVEEMLGKNVIFQDRHNLQQVTGSELANRLKRGQGTTKEFRVHVVGGHAPWYMAMPRYNSGNPLHVLRDMPEAWRTARWVNKEVIPNMPKHLRENLAGGIDVGKLQNGGNTVIELNAAGQSGLLDAPIAGYPMLHRATTGRHTIPVAAGAATLLGGAGAGATYAAQKALGDSESSKT